MKRCFRWQLRVLGCCRWLLPLLPAMALLMGWAASAPWNAGLRRMMAADPWSALAHCLDDRRFFPMAGAVWSILWLGMDFDGGTPAMAISRGVSPRAVFWSKYLLFLGGCAFVSLAEQGSLFLFVGSLRAGFPAAHLFRCSLLRLGLDLGMMALPSVFCYLGRDNPVLRLAGLLWGLALWRLMGSHEALWLPSPDFVPGWRELWPLAALLLSPICCRLLFLRR